MAGTHYVTKCSCGTILSQCRCPSRDKKVIVIERGCALCHASTVEVKMEGRGWRISNKGDEIFLTKADLDAVNAILHRHYHEDD